MDSTTKKSGYATDCLVIKQARLYQEELNIVSVNIQKTGCKNFKSIVVSSILKSVVKKLPMITRPLEILLMNSPRLCLMKTLALNTFTALYWYYLPRHTLTMAEKKALTYLGSQAKGDCSWLCLGHRHTQDKTDSDWEKSLSKMFKRCAHGLPWRSSSCDSRLPV